MGDCRKFSEIYSGVEMMDWFLIWMEGLRLEEGVTLIMPLPSFTLVMQATRKRSFSVAPVAGAIVFVVGGAWVDRRCVYGCVFLGTCVEESWWRKSRV